MSFFSTCFILGTYWTAPFPIYLIIIPGKCYSAFPIRFVLRCGRHGRFLVPKCCPSHAMLPYSVGKDTFTHLLLIRILRALAEAACGKRPSVAEVNFSSITCILKQKRL